MVTALCAASLFLSFFGCGSSASVNRSAVPRRPDLTLTVGSLNVSSYKKRIERNDLVRFAGVLKKEGIDVLGVQGITRYPGVATRTDFVDVLASLTGMRSAFGASSDNSGRQVGHAVFTVYPVRSHLNIPFENTGSDDFESALLLIVDAGVRDIQVANMLLPRNSTRAVDEKCLQTVVKQSYEELPLLLIGNFSGRPAAGFSALPEQKSGEQQTPSTTVWVHQGEVFEILSVRNAQSNFGEFTIAMVGVFRAGTR